MATVTVDDTTLRLLAAIFGTDTPDVASVRVLSDRLEEIGRLDLKWVLAGRCPLCGGELHEQRLKGDDIYRSLLGDPYMRCRQCKEEDVEAIKPAAKQLSAARVNRVVRALRLKKCEAESHWKESHQLRGVVGMTWFPADGCQRCGGLGLLRR